jgi:ParB-like chromosome segregation protein Spo0J
VAWTPVELYQCGGDYYVLDGRHRIAVARALGQREVWATVTQVRTNLLGSNTRSWR